MLKLEQTEKFLCGDETEAELFIEKLKENDEAVLIDYKVSKKETKNGEYFVVTTKLRYLTLAEGKEKMNG